MKFTRNFIRREAPKFTVEVACQMDGCPAKVTIQQLACGKNNFENIFTLTFQGNIKCKRGDLKARRLIDTKKTEIYSKFQNNLNTKPSNLFKEKLGSLDQNQYGLIIEVELEKVCLLFKASLHGLEGKCLMFTTYSRKYWNCKSNTK